MAWKLGDEYSKDQILAEYLNSLPFGRRAYGVEAAAQAYFGKSADTRSQQRVNMAEAILRVEPASLDHLLHPRLDPKAKAKLLATGLAASPGAAVGVAVFDADTAAERGAKKHKVILLITDGEYHGSDPVGAAREAAREGVVIHALAVGTPTGGPIPVRDAAGSLLGYHRDDSGRVVTTRSDETLLGRVCAETGGVALRLDATGSAVRTIGSRIDAMEKKEQKGTLASRREELFPQILCAHGRLL